MVGRGKFEDIDVTEGYTRLETTVGRVIFNRRCLPQDYPFINYKLVKSDISALVNDCCDRYNTAEVEPILDAIKSTGFHYATLAGLTVSVWDAVIPDDKQLLLEETQDRVDQINEYYEDGFLAERERHVEVVNAWTECTGHARPPRCLAGFAEDNPIFMMADLRCSRLQDAAPAARGHARSHGRHVWLIPSTCRSRQTSVRASNRLSTSSRPMALVRVLVDTASHTSDSGYLTRRLVDVAQDVIVREEDCGTDEGGHVSADQVWRERRRCRPHRTLHDSRHR